MSLSSLPDYQLSADTKAILLLCSKLHEQEALDVSPLSPARYNQLAEWLVSQQMRPSDLLTFEGQERLRRIGQEIFDIDQILRLLQRGGFLALAVESWTNQGLWVISRSDVSYPQRLKDRLKRYSPAILYGAGNAALLTSGGLSVVGSRNADPAALAFTREVARRCAHEETPIISGGARGVDREAMITALAQGGKVIGVLSDSLSQASLSGQYRHALLANQLVLLSPYPPAATFKVGNAMDRNKLIYALSDYALVVSAGDRTGGTWAGADENLKKKWVPLFVRSGEGIPAGNLHLIERGGTRFDPTLLLDTLKPLTAILGELAADQAPATASESSQKSIPANAELLSLKGEVPKHSEKINTATNMAEITPDLFWNSNVWPVLAELVAQRGMLTRDGLVKALGVRPAQADAWLQQAVEEGKLMKVKKKSIRYVLAADQQLPLLN